VLLGNWTLAQLTEGNDGDERDDDIAHCARWLPRRDDARAPRVFSRFSKLVDRFGAMRGARNARSTIVAASTGEERGGRSREEPASWILDRSEPEKSNPRDTF